MPCNTHKLSLTTENNTDFVILLTSQTWGRCLSWCWCIYFCSNFYHKFQFFLPTIPLFPHHHINALSLYLSFSLSIYLTHTISITLYPLNHFLCPLPFSTPGPKEHNSILQIHPPNNCIRRPQYHLPAPDSINLMNWLFSANCLTNISESAFFVNIVDIAPPGRQPVVAQIEDHLNSLPLDSISHSYIIQFSIDIINNLSIYVLILPSPTFHSSHLLRMLVTFDGQKNPKIWQIQILKMSSTCKTQELYIWLYWVLLLIFQ